MIDDIDLIQLNTNEVEEIELNSLFGSSTKNKQSELMLDIIHYNKQNEIFDFIDFYCITYPKKCDNIELKNKLENNIRVKKSRLNSHIKHLNLYIGKDYNIYRINASSPQHLGKEILDMLNKKHIASVKIFDSYQENDKSKILTTKVMKFLEKMLNHGRSVHIISIFNDTHTKNFYQKLLAKYEEINNDSILEVQYIRKPFIQSSSMLYALITDTDDNDYIFYYETITQWYVVTPVNNNFTFTLKFHQLLEKRYDYYLNEKSLKDSNEIVRVDSQVFSGSFSSRTEILILDLEELLKSNIKNENVIKQKIHYMINKLKKIKIAYPSSKNANSILFHHIKLVEIVLLLQANKDLPETRNVLKQLIESDLTKEVYLDMKNQILGDKFILLDNEVCNLDLKELQKNLFLGNYFLSQTITDLYSDYLWNTYEQIVHSFNLILMDSESSYKLIETFLLDSDKVSILDNIKYIKIIFRSILETFYKIKFSIKLDLSEEEIKELEIIRFTNEMISINIQKYCERTI